LKEQKRKMEKKVEREKNGESFEAYTRKYVVEHIVSSID